MLTRLVTWRHTVLWFEPESNEITGDLFAFHARHQIVALTIVGVELFFFVFQHFHHIASADHAFILRHQVLAEEYAASFIGAELGQRSERFFRRAEFTFLHIDRSQYAAFARFHRFKLNVTDTNALPAVFAKRFSPRHH